MINFIAVTDGGQKTRANAFINLFRKYDIDSTLIILRRKNTLSFCNSIPNVRVIDVSISNTIFRPWFRLLWENINLRFIVRRIQPDIYLSFSHYLPTAISKKIISIIGVTNLAPFTPLALTNEKYVMRAKMKLLSYSITSSAKKATHVIALSKLCKKTLINKGVKNKNITVINNGAYRASKTNSVPPLVASVIEENFFLYVSSFFPYKNFDVLIKAYSLLPKEIINNFQLVLIGTVQDKSYFKELKALVSILNINDRVVFIPEVPREELDYFYINTALFIFPSLIENCPNILLEALSFGCPVLCSSAKPMPEFGGDAVKYFNPNSTSSLHKVLLTTINNQSLLKRMSKQSKKRSKIYSWNIFTKSVIDLIKEIR